MQTYQVIQLILSLVFPIILVIGSYIALKIDVTRNQEKILAIKEDLAEIKADVKILINKIIKI